MVHPIGTFLKRHDVPFLALYEVAPPGVAQGVVAGARIPVQLAN